MLNLAEEMERKKEMEKNQKSKDQDPENQDQRLPMLEAQVKLLQEQLQDKRRSEDDQKLQADADELQKEQAVLEEEANLRRVLGDAWNAKTKEAPEGQDLDQKEMISVMAEAVGKAVDANTKLILGKVDGMIKGVDGKITGTQKALVELMAMRSIEDARSEFRDFDEHKVEISEILGQTRGLSPEDAYILAKGRKASKVPDQKTAESEKPNTAPSALSRRESSSSKGDEDFDFSSPRKVFKDALSKAIDKHLSAREK